MRKIIVNILATTGIALVVLAVIAAIYDAKFLLINAVFQTLGATIVIHLGLLLTRKFESNYPLLEAAIDIAWTVPVLISAGAVFGWYSSTPIFVLIIMGAMIYLIGIVLRMVRVRADIAEINSLLQRRKQK